MVTRELYAHPYPDPEIRDLARGILAVYRHGKIRLSTFEASVLWRIRRDDEGLSLPDKRFVLRQWKRVIDAQWDAYILDDIPQSAPSREVVAAVAARDALGIAPKVKGEKRVKKKTDSEKKKTKRKPELREAEIFCPACGSGAILYCWADKGDNVFFSCRNRFCARKTRTSATDSSRFLSMA